MVAGPRETITLRSAVPVRAEPRNLQRSRGTSNSLTGITSHAWHTIVPGASCIAPASGAAPIEMTCLAPGSVGVAVVPAPKRGTDLDKVIAPYGHAHN